LEVQEQVPLLFRFLKLLIEQNEDGSKRRNAARKKELEAAGKRISELSAICKRLYEDSVAGRISDERFTELSADYEAEQKELTLKNLPPPSCVSLWRKSLCMSVAMTRTAHAGRTLIFTTLSLAR